MQNFFMKQCFDAPINLASRKIAHLSTLRPTAVRNPSFPAKILQFIPSVRIETLLLRDESNETIHMLIRLILYVL